MSDREIGPLFERAPFRITHDRWCPMYCEWSGGECVTLRQAGTCIGHWHTRRVLRRTRSIAECVVLALTAMQDAMAEELRERAQHAAAKDFTEMLVADGLIEASRGATPVSSP